MDRIVTQNSITFASVCAVKGVANVVVDLVDRTMRGLHHALAHLLRIAGMAPEGLLGRLYGRLQPAVVPAAQKAERNRSRRPVQPTTSWRRATPRPGTERKS